MKTILTFISITIFTLPGLWAQSWDAVGDNLETSDAIYVGIRQSNPQSILSIGGGMASRKLALWDSSTDWYGFGLLGGLLRLQVGNTNARFGFFAGTGSSNTEIVSIHGDGKMDVGDIPSSAHNNDYLLYVDRGIQTGRVKTKASLADYVFQPDYEPMPLAEVEQYVWQHHHLPGVISQAEVDEAGGVELTAFTVQLQEKLEELYLHTIEQEKRIAELERRLAEETEISERAEKTERAEISETPDAASPHPTPAQPQEEK